MGMEGLYTAIDWLTGILVAGLLTMIGFSSTQQYAVRWLLAVISVLTIFRWVMWSALTEVRWEIRGMIGAILGATLLILVPLLWNARSGANEPSPPASASAVPSGTSELASGESNMPKNDAPKQTNTEVVGAEIVGKGQKGPAAEIINSSGDPNSVGAEIKATGTPGQNITGLRVSQEGPGTGLKVTQVGPGTGLKVSVTAVPDQSKPAPQSPPTTKHDP